MTDKEKIVLLKDALGTIAWRADIGAASNSGAPLLKQLAEMADSCLENVK